MNTMLLAVDTWDMVLDANGNFAFATEPYSLAQDVASAVRTFLGEVWYDNTLGIPYRQQILANRPPLSLLKQYIVNAALAVPDVVSATCIIQSYSRITRQVIGQVQFIDINHQSGSVSL